MKIKKIELPTREWIKFQIGTKEQVKEIDGGVPAVVYFKRIDKGWVYIPRKGTFGTSTRLHEEEVRAIFEILTSLTNEEGEGKWSHSIF